MFAFSIASIERGPCEPAMPLSLLILGSKAGSIGGIFECSTVPTITCFSVSHSFHELTVVIFAPIN